MVRQTDVSYQRLVTLQVFEKRFGPHRAYFLVRYTLKTCITAVFHAYWYPSDGYEGLRDDLGITRVIPLDCCKPRWILRGTEGRQHYGTNGGKRKMQDEARTCIVMFLFEELAKKRGFCKVQEIALTYARTTSAEGLDNGKHSSRTSHHIYSPVFVCRSCWYVVHRHGV